MKTSNKSKTSKSNIVINRAEILKDSWTMFKSQKQNETPEMFSSCMKASWKLAKNGLTLSSIYSNHFKYVLKQVEYKVNDTILAEDLTCTVFEKKLFRYLIVFNPERSNIRTWLMTIANNLIKDYYKTEYKKHKQNLYVSNFQDEDGNEYFQLTGSSDVQEEIEGIETNVIINKAFNKLEGLKKEIAQMNIIEGKQYKEIAEILNIPISKVSVYLMRAKEQMKKELGSIYTKSNVVETIDNDKDYYFESLDMYNY